MNTLQIAFMIKRLCIVIGWIFLFIFIPLFVGSLMGVKDLINAWASGFAFTLVAALVVIVLIGIIYYIIDGY